MTMTAYQDITCPCHSECFDHNTLCKFLCPGVTRQPGINVIWAGKAGTLTWSRKVDSGCQDWRYYYDH